MKITFRKYESIKDYLNILEFLEKSYLSYGTQFYNNITLFEFQCALSRGLVDSNASVDKALENYYIWFDDDQIVGIIEEESFCIDLEYKHLFEDMIKVAEESNKLREIESSWEVYDNDAGFENILLKLGYSKSQEYWTRRELDLQKFEKSTELPSGFSVGLALEHNNQDEIYKAYKLCYGIMFNKNIFSNFYETSTYRKELDLVVTGPNEELVAICSGRYDKKNKLATIEAVSCFHEYRRMGISEALQIILLNNAKKLGANSATVYTAMAERYLAPNNLYEKVGFKLSGNLYVWRKENNK